MEDAEDGIGIPRRVGHDFGGPEFRLLLQDDGKQMEAVAQSSGYCNCVQASELIGSQLVPGDTPFYGGKQGIASEQFKDRGSYLIVGCCVIEDHDAHVPELQRGIVKIAQ